jgi:hypothetical protein
MADELDNLVLEDTKKNKSKKALLLLLLLLIIFFGYKILAPNQKTFALGDIPKTVYTKANNLTGCGAKPNSKVKIILNGSDPIFIDTDTKGCISYSVELSEGINKIEFFDLSSNESIPVTAMIEYIIKSPLLEISEPVQNSEIKIANGKKNQDIMVKGKTDPGVNIFVNGDKVAVGDNGEFETKIQLSLGEDKIKIVADNGEKTTEQEITVKLVEDKVANNNSTNPVNSNNNPNTQNTSNTGNNTNNQQTDNQVQPDSQPLVIYPSKVIISYILYSNDPNSVGYGEYIELKNTGDIDKDITGWTVSDSDGNSFTFPSYILTPGSTVRVTTNSGRFLFNSTKPVWDRLGEAGYLKDASGKMVDAYSY